MTKEELKNKMSILEVGLKQNFEKDGFLQPILFVFHSEGSKKEVTYMPVLDMEKKYETFESLGNDFKNRFPTKKVDGIVFLSEAWVSKYKELPKGEIRSPSQDPHRIEMAVMGGMTDKYETYAIIFEMKNKSDPQKRKLTNREEIDQPIQSDLLNAFWKGFGTIVNL